jgi:hypothetical protein
MKVPKTAGIDPLDSMDVLASGFWSGANESGGDVYAYRGEPKKNISGVPKGKMWLLNKGLLFLPIGVTDRRQALHDVLSSYIGPLALFTLAGKLRAPTTEKIHELFDDPDALIIPYSEIVEASIVTFGGLFNKRKFLVFRREPANGEAVQHCITPTDGFPSPQALMTLRLFYEQPVVLWKILCNEADDDNTISKMQEDYQNLYPNGATSEQRKEFIHALSAKMTERINAKGVPSNLLHARALNQLEHFRGLSPDFDQGLDAIQWAKGK